MLKTEKGIFCDEQPGEDHREGGAGDQGGEHQQHHPGAEVRRQEAVQRHRNRVAGEDEAKGDAGVGEGGAEDPEPGQRRQRGLGALQHDAGDDRPGRHLADLAKEARGSTRRPARRAGRGRRSSRATPPIQSAIRARRRASGCGRSGTEAKLATDEGVPACRRADSARRPARAVPGGRRQPANCSAATSACRAPSSAAGSRCRCAARTRRSARTRVAFALRKRADRKRPSLGTIVAMDGGPGYASTAAPYARSLVAALGPLLRRRDLVLFDERGTGRSDAVDCPGLQNGLTQEAIAVGECANRLGPRYAGYTTAEAAADLEAVRRALGLGRVFFYGDSYGTLFGQAYAVRYPGALRGLILDSAYPADDPYYRTLLPAGLEGLRDRLPPRAELQRRPGRPPHPRRRSLPRRPPLDRGPAGLPAAGRHAGAALLPQPRRRRPPLPRRRPAPARAAARTRVRPGTASSREFSYGLEIAVECNDYPLLWDTAAGDRRARPPALRRGDADAEGPLRPLRPPRVPALARRPT